MVRGHEKRRNATENTRVVVEIRMEGKHPRRRSIEEGLGCDGRTLSEGTCMTSWKIRKDWATDRDRWKGLCKTHYNAQGDGIEDEKFHKQQLLGNLNSDLTSVARE